MKLTAGNSDLYGGASAPTDSIVLRRLGELYPGLSGASLAAMHINHKYDLVFYYKSESHDANILPYLRATNVASIGGTVIDDFESWLVGGDGRSITYAERNADGTAITKYGGVIEPHHSDKASDYFTYNKGGEGSITRYTEYYKILYTVTDGDQTYVVSRNVKLRYQAGDVNLDGYIDNGDATAINSFSQGGTNFFINPDGQVNNELCSAVGDFNYDGYADNGDATQINAFSQGSTKLPKLRF